MKNFKYLLAAVAALALAAWFASHQEQQKYAAHEPALFLPELAQRLGELDEVRVHAAGEEPVTLKLVDGAWRVVERDGFPAATELLRRELRKLAEAKALEQKTSQAEYYARLGVQDVDLAGDTTLRLTALSGGETVVDLLVGKAGKGGNYVRRADEAESWLLDTRLSFPRAAPAWLAKDLVDVDRRQVERVEVSPVEGQDFQLVRGEEEDAELALEPPAPEGREVNVANVNRLGAALSRLRLRDLAAERPDGLDWAELVYHRDDGLRLTVRAAKQDSSRYLELSAAAAEDAAEELAGEVRRINALAEGRSFEMSQHAVDAMRMSYEMMLKKLPEDDAEG